MEGERESRLVTDAIDGLSEWFEYIYQDPCNMQTAAGADFALGRSMVRRSDRADWRKVWRLDFPQTQRIVSLEGCGLLSRGLSSATEGGPITGLG